MYRVLFHWTIFIAAIALALPSIFSSTSFAGSFLDSSFDEAETEAQKIEKSTNHTQEGKKTGKGAADSLGTAGTVKEVADYVGLAATTATIGSELYNLTTNDADEKIAALNKQYQNALAQGNFVQAEVLLTQLNSIKEQKKKIAKDQSGTHKSLSTIQTVAGVANIGAAGASFYAAYSGYDAASDLKEAQCESSGTANCQKLNLQAAKKAKAAANTALYFGAGELALGAGSIFLAGEHDKEAKSLESLSNDPLKDIPGAQASELALFDKVAFTKCGSGASYQLLDAPPPPAVVSSTGVRSVATTASTATSPYQAIYDRIQCIASSSSSGSGSSSGGSSSGSGTTTQCASDTLQCWDGTIVSRNPAQGCAFHPCPTTTSPIPAPGSGQPRFISGASSGASRLQMDDVGHDVEKNQDKILNDK